MRTRTLYQTMALIALAYVLFSSKAHGQYVVYEYATQCPGGCGPWYCEPQQQYYQGPRQQPRQQGPQPDGQQTPPVGAPGTPQFESLPGPPQPTTPDIDRPALDSKTADDIKALQSQVAALEKQLAQVKECDCDGCCDKVRAELNAKIEVLAASNVMITTDVKNLQAGQPNYDQIAAEVQKRLPPIYMRVNPQAQYQPVHPGQYVTLPLDRQ